MERNVDLFNVMPLIVGLPFKYSQISTFTPSYTWSQTLTLTWPHNWYWFNSVHLVTFTCTISSTMSGPVIWLLLYLMANPNPRLQHNDVNTIMTLGSVVRLLPIISPSALPQKVSISKWHQQTKDRPNILWWYQILLTYPRLEFSMVYFPLNETPKFFTFQNLSIVIGRFNPL